MDLLRILESSYLRVDEAVVKNICLSHCCVYHPEIYFVSLLLVLNLYFFQEIPLLDPLPITSTNRSNETYLSFNNRNKGRRKNVVTMLRKRIISVLCFKAKDETKQIQIRAHQRKSFQLRKLMISYKMFDFMFTSILNSTFVFFFSKSFMIIHRKHTFYNS